MSEAWHVEAAVPVAAASALYLRGRLALAGRARDEGGHRTGAGAQRAPRDASFAAGSVALLAALASPLHALAEESFAAHMVQHLALILVAAPLLVLARPGGVLLAGLPGAWRRRIARLRRPARRAFAWSSPSWPVVVWAAHAAALWIWHAPALFEPALSSEPLHALEHAVLLGTAVPFWWLAAGAARRPAYGAVYCLLAATQTGLLAALLTLSPEPWYEPYRATRATAAATDQHLAGVLMWVPAGIVYVAAGVAFFLRWLSADAGPDDPIVFAPDSASTAGRP